ncbi:uncharacterized protein LOC132706820 [Cylas formicarius]|uniref:uncharacterized protein LOC132706820 n=1 Tax=Cylas formicarius TaxID=197179 RepID=UPI002958B015|nr:uncharacterized protein LOC132706820 [Cylas formicarius]
MENMFATLWLSTLALVFVLAFLLYLYSTRKYDYWKRRNVQYVKPLPYMGNFLPVFLLKKTLGEFTVELYEKTTGPYVGIYIFDQPYLVMKDPYLIKEVLLKDFSHFENRGITAPESNPLLSNFMFFKANPGWKKIRTKMSPVFTSGKLKMMFPLIQTEAEKMATYLRRHVTEKSTEAKEVCAKYSTNVIASCAFAVDAQCYDREDAEFRKIGRRIFDFRISNAARQLTAFFLPDVVRLLKVCFFEESSLNWMSTIFASVLSEREKLTSLRGNDLVDMLLEIKRKDTKDEFTHDAIIAQAAQFFVAGFETVSSTLSFMIYELAIHEGYQKKVREEIAEAIEKHGGLTYEAVNTMKFLDMCVRETLRKYPVLSFLDRRCTNTYKVPNSDLVIEKGIAILIPLFGLHYDQKYFPNPNEFIPERFEDMNQINKEGYYYLPFGEGPRICIGERFGLLGVKLGAINILKEFKVEKTKDTPIPMVFEPRSLLLQSTVGIPVRISPLDDMLATLSLSTLALAFILALVLYVYSTRKYDYWKKRNVPYLKPLPYLGNFLPVFLLRKTLGEFTVELYEKIAGPYLGIYIFDQPYLVIKDPYLIKEVLLKDFSHFENRGITAPEGNSVMSNFMFVKPNPGWKKIRTKMSPVFTSGKLKMMFPLIQMEAEKMTAYLRRNISEKSTEAKEVCAKYSTNVIASCAFAVDAQCYDREDAEFRKIGRTVFDFRMSTAARQVAAFFLPAAVRLFKISFVEQSSLNSMSAIFASVLSEREKLTSLRGNDLVDMLLEIKRKDTKDEFTHDAIIAQAAQFFVAGFETVSSTLSFMIYELALHEGYQQKAREEITEVIEKHGGLTYEAVKDMKFLDMCVRETLRKYPVLPFLDRRCTNTYKVPDSDLVIEKEIPILIPMFGLHYDEKYFPNPYEFIPQRFEDMNQINKEGYYYIPFGEGPRICIGERFGLLGVKLGAINILKGFNVEKTNDTPVPLVFEPKSLLLQSTVGIPVRISPLVGK